MVSAQQWFELEYPQNGSCRGEYDKLNKGKTRDQILELDVSNQNLEGKLELGLFNNAYKINVSLNQLTSFSWNKSDVIKILDMSHNKIGITNNKIRFARETALQKLNISSNKISNLSFLNNDLSFGTPSLTHLDISNNFLTELNLEGNKNLAELNCTGNSLSSLLLSPSISPHLINCEVSSPPFVFDWEKFGLIVGIISSLIAIVATLMGLRRIGKLGQWLASFRQRREHRRNSQQLDEQTNGDIELETRRTNE